MADFCILSFAPSLIRLRWPHPSGRPRSFSVYRADPWGPVIKVTCQILLTHPIADFYTLSLAPSPIGPRWLPARGWPRSYSAYSPYAWGQVIKLTCQILFTHLVVDFCTLGFTPSPIGPRWLHLRGLQRWFSAYRPEPWVPVIKIACQILLTHALADFCTLGFAPSPIGPRWPPPKGRQTWFSTYIPDPCGPVIKLTCQIFLTHPVADFCKLGFAPLQIGPRWLHHRGQLRRFSAYRPDPYGASNQTNLSDPPNSTSGRFQHLCFRPHTHSKHGCPLWGGRDGSRPVGLISGCQ